MCYYFLSQYRRSYYQISFQEITKFPLVQRDLSIVIDKSITYQQIDKIISNNIKTDDIDAVILGNNGDAQFDGYYNVANTIFSKTPQVYYKHLSGEYNTASSFGFWVASKILKTQQIPIR